MISKFTPVSHVIFDMDGVLLDSESRYQNAQERALQKYGVVYTKEAREAATGRTGNGAAHTLVNFFKLPVSGDEFNQQVRAMYPEVFGKYIPLLPGVDKLVSHLKSNNVPIAIATSSGEYSFGLKSQHHPDFFRMFDHIVKGDDPELKNGKPSPDIYLLALSRFENFSSVQNMKNVLVIEDSTNGVKAATAAGMQVLWVPSHGIDPGSAEATLTLKSLEDFSPEDFGMPPFK